MVKCGPSCKLFNISGPLGTLSLTHLVYAYIKYTEIVRPKGAAAAAPAVTRSSSGERTGGSECLLLADLVFRKPLEYQPVCGHRYARTMLYKSSKM